MTKTLMLLGAIFVLLLVAVFVYTMPTPESVVAKPSSGGSLAAAANSGVSTIAVVGNSGVEVTAEVL